MRFFRLHNSGNAVLLVFLFVLTGCKSEGVSGLVPVSGKVTVEGTPLAGAGVAYQPDKGNESPHIPSATTDAEGRYELTTAAKSKVAPPGWYKIVITPPAPPKTAGEAPKTVTAYNQKYMKSNTTDLSVEVKANAPEGA